MSVGLGDGLLSLAAGGLTTLSPCVFPVLPLVLGGALGAHRLAPVAMGSGLVVSFALFGVLIGLLGDVLGLDADLVRQFGAWIMLGLGLALLWPGAKTQMGRLFNPLASSAQALSQRVQTTSLLGAFALGALLGLVWSPCSGPMLASAITLVASEGGALRGAALLGLFGLGAALPLIAIAYASRAAVGRARNWVMAHMDRISRAFGAVLLLLGLSILNGWDKRIEALVVAWLPDQWVKLTVLF